MTPSYEPHAFSVRVHKVRSQVDGPDGGERRWLPKVGLRRQLRQVARVGADPLRRAEEAGAGAQGCHRRARGGAPDP